VNFSLLIIVDWETEKVFNEYLNFFGYHESFSWKTGKVCF